MSGICLILIGVIIGVVLTILRLGIKGNLVVHYFDNESVPYMSLELEKPVGTVEKHKIIVLRVIKRDHRTPQE